MIGGNAGLQVRSSMLPVAAASRLNAALAAVLRELLVAAGLRPTWGAAAGIRLPSVPFPPAVRLIFQIRANN